MYFIECHRCDTHFVAPHPFRRNKVRLQASLSVKSLHVKPYVRSHKVLIHAQVASVLLGEYLGYSNQHCCGDNMERTRWDDIFHTSCLGKDYFVYLWLSPLIHTQIRFWTGFVFFSDFHCLYPRCFMLEIMQKHLSISCVATIGGSFHCCPPYFSSCFWVMSLAHYLWCIWWLGPFSPGWAQAVSCGMSSCPGIKTNTMPQDMKQIVFDDRC